MTTWALASSGQVLQFNYWYSTNNYDNPKKLVQDLQERGYVLSLDYHETVLTSFKIIDFKQKEA